MNKEEKCISLSLAQELQKIAKKNKFELPESEHMWFNLANQEEKDKGIEKWEIMNIHDVEMLGEYPAYDTSELGKIIPGNIEGLVFQMQKGMLGNLYYCMMIDSIDYVIRHQEEAKTEAEARGQMFSYLIKNKLT